MKTPIKYSFSALLALFLLASCETAPENQVTYDFTRNGVSTVSFSGQTARIGMATELLAAMQDLDRTSIELAEMYANQTPTGEDVAPFSDPALNSSTKSIKSKIAASADFFSSNTVEGAAIKETIQSYIEEQANEVFVAKDEQASARQAGRLTDSESTQLVNAQGLVLDEVVKASISGALMIDQICNNYVSTSVLDAGTNVEENNQGLVEAGKPYTTMEHKWDEAYGYLFGATGIGQESEPLLNDDPFLNALLTEINGDTDFNTIADDVFYALAEGRAAIVEQNYDLRNIQATIIKEKLALVIAVNTVKALQLGKQNLNNNLQATAFAELSKAYGLIQALRFLRQPNSNQSIFSNAEVSDLKEQMISGEGLWDITPATIDDVSAAITSKFDFSIAETIN